jgi:hypothetical protein
MPSLNGYTTVEVNDATGKYYKFAVTKIDDVPYASLHRAIEAANEKDNITITLCNNINLGNNFEVLTITKNLTIDGEGYTITGVNITEEENPKNKFNSMFDVNASDIEFTLKNITINYESSTTSISRGAVIYNYDKTATINIENSTIVGSKVIYSNNTDSTVNILGSTIIGTVNGVNFTDGLDGLASSVTVLVATFFTVVAIGTQSGIEPVTCAVVGALLGFLLFNVYPASVFMGDTGSLALGGFVASTAYMLQMPIFIIIVGMIYLVEVLSVMIQVTYFKKTGGKRIFKMAPIHHHFELCGWSETRVVTVFSAVTAVMCMIAYLAL